MKNTIKILAMLAIVTMAGIANAQSDASTTANVTATVIVPITITKTSDMSLGKIVGAPAAGAMVIAADGTRTFTHSANTYATNTAAGSAAAFHITGDPSCTFSTAHTGNGAGGANNGLWLSDGNGNSMWFLFDADVTGQTLTNGVNDVKVTGTLAIGAGQAAGSYTGSFTELVTYE
jgi:hypothetical protein